MYNNQLIYRHLYSQCFQEVATINHVSTSRGKSVPKNVFTLLSPPTNSCFTLHLKIQSVYVAFINVKSYKSFSFAFATCAYRSFASAPSSFTSACSLKMDTQLVQVLSATVAINRHIVLIGLHSPVTMLIPIGHLCCQVHFITRIIHDGTRRVPRPLIVLLLLLKEGDCCLETYPVKLVIVPRVFQLDCADVLGLSLYGFVL